MRRNRLQPHSELTFRVNYKRGQQPHYTVSEYRKFFETLKARYMISAYTTVKNTINPLILL